MLLDVTWRIVARLMRASLTVFFLLPCLAESADTLSLNEVHSLSLGEVVQRLREDGFNIIYNTAQINSSAILDISGLTPSATSSALAAYGFELRHLKDKTYLVSRINAPPAGRLVGEITDQTGQALAGISVLAGTDHAVLTDDKGRFELDHLTPGELVVQLSDSHGELLETRTLTIESGWTSRYNARVHREDSIETLVVTSSLYRMLSQHTVQSNLLTADRMLNQAAVAGDVLRLANNLPGSANNGLSARPSVRGGHLDETLIIFDDVQLYEPFHLKDVQSLVSAFDPAVVDAIEMYSGGFQARFGDRMSAVMKIDPLIPEIGSTRQIGLGLYHLSAFFSEQDPESAGDWMFAARRSNLELLTRYVETDLGDPEYYDGFMQFNYSIDSLSRLSGNVFLSQDKVATQNANSTEEATSKQRNSSAWLHYDRQHTDNLSSRSTLQLVELDSHRRGLLNDPRRVTGSLSDDRHFRIATVSQRWELLYSRNLMMDFGWTYTYLDGRYNYRSDQRVEDPWQSLARGAGYGLRVLDRELSGLKYSGYGSVKLQLPRHFTMELGARIDAQDKMDQRDHRQVSPRLSLLYDGGAAWQARLSWGRFYQSRGIHELQVEDGEVRFDPAQCSEHLIASYQHSFDNHMRLRFEVYEKRINSAADYFDNLYNTVSLMPELQPDRVKVSPRDARSIGAELSMQAPFGDAAEWWFSYSYARAGDDIGGQRIRRSWDQESAVDLGVGWRYRDWHLDLHLDYHTGWPTTDLMLVAGSSDSDATVEIMAGERNHTRLEYYFSLDFKAVREYQLRNSTLRLEAGLVNITNRRNQMGREFRLYDDADDIERLKMNHRSSLPITPVLDLRWSF